MFIREIHFGPRYVDGKKFAERTIRSKFDKGNVEITTVFMNDKPLLKQYTFDTPNAIKTFWKSMRKDGNISEVVVNKLDTTV